MPTSSSRCSSADAPWSRMTTRSRRPGSCSTRPGSPGRTTRPSRWRRPPWAGSSWPARPAISPSCSPRSTRSPPATGSRAATRAAVEHTRERLELLRDAPRTATLDVERSDALHMMIECLLQTGDFHEAERYAREARDLDLSRGIIYSAWQRGLLPGLLPGPLGRGARHGDPCPRGLGRGGAAAARSVRHLDRLRRRDPGPARATTAGSSGSRSPTSSPRAPWATRRASS